MKELKFNFGCHYNFSSHLSLHEYCDTSIGLRIWRITETQKIYGGYGIGTSKVYFETEKL